MESIMEAGESEEENLGETAIQSSVEDEPHPGTLDLKQGTETVLEPEAVVTIRPADCSAMSRYSLRRRVVAPNCPMVKKTRSGSSFPGGRGDVTNPS